MIRNRLFTLKQVYSAYVILPIGQAICDHVSSLEVNEFGALIWEELADDITEEVLLSRLAEKVGPIDNINFFTKIVNSFLCDLSKKGMLDGFSREKTDFGSDSTTFRVGDVFVLLKCPLQYLSDKVKRFCKEGEPYLYTVSVEPWHPDFSHKMSPVCISKDMVIEEDATSVYVRYPLANFVKSLRMDKETLNTTIYTSSFCNDMITELETALRFPILRMAGAHHMLMLHSSSVLYKDQLILFSAPAEVGKSTQARLWCEEYGATPINGDLNLLKLEGDTVKAYGIPWCGTSEIYSEKTYNVSAIVFLSQSPENKVISLTDSDKALALVKRSIEPILDEETLDRNLEIAKGISEPIQVKLFFCNMEKEAATKLHSALFPK